MKVSVIIPVYNTQQYLADCLNSFLHQTENDIEIICINDTSDDDSLDILKKFAKKDKRIRYTTIPHAGAGAARNKGIEIAKGEYIYFFDSDDIASIKLLSSAVLRAEKTSADIVVFNGYTFQNDNIQDKKNKDGFNVNAVKRSGLFNNVFSWKDFPNDIMSIINVVPWNKLYKTEFVKKLPFRFNEISSTNDIAFSALSVAAAERIAVIPDRLTYYRINRNDSITSTKKKNLNNVKYAINSVIDTAKKFQYYNEIRGAVTKFVLNNYVFAFENYCTDLNEEDSKTFYSYIHDLFNGESFASLKARDIEMSETNCSFRLFKNIQKYTLTQMTEIINREIIVSLTSIPYRISTLYLVIDNLIEQTKKADKILIWLSNDEFPNGEKDLPGTLLKHKLEGNVEIHFCDNLYAHKKYYYTMLNNPDSVVIMVDDDLVYKSDMIAELWHLYLCYPECISTMRSHIITVDRVNKKISPYDEWIKECKTNNTPSMQAFSTNGAGALYPPHLLNEHVFDKDKLLQICKAADDIWLNAMAVANNVRTISTNTRSGLKYLDDTQEERLYNINVKGNQNDVQFEKVSNWLKEIYGYDIIYDNICSVEENEFLDTAKLINLVQNKYKEELRLKNKKINDLKTKNKHLKKRIKKLKVRLKRSKTISGSIKNIINRLVEKIKKSKKAS